MLLTSCALAIFALAACGTNQKQSKEKQESSTVQKASSDKEHYKGTYSNLNSKASVEEVRTLLSAYLDQESVDKFLGLVMDYDSIVGSVGLTGDFQQVQENRLQCRKISDLWTKQKGDFVGTNCRINELYLAEEPHRDSLSNRRIVNSYSWIMMLLTKERSSMRQTRKPLTFSIHEFRQRLQRMSRSMPRRWKSIF